MVSAENDPRRPGVFWVFHLDWPTPSGLAPRLPATFVRLGPEAADMLTQAMGQEDSAEVLRRFEAGRRQVDEMTLYVTRGLGLEGKGAPRVRFLCPPEIILWEIGGP